MPSPALLTIAGFDPSSGAGVTADLAVFAAHGFFGTSCITALTVQSTRGVRAMEPVAAALVRTTLECLEEDLPAAGVKIGMLGTAANVFAVADFLARKADGARVPVVLDPVLVSTSGQELLSCDGVTALKERLLPLASWVTPNRGELARLLGWPDGNGRAWVEGAARELTGRFAGLSLVVTGGEEDSPDDYVTEAGGACGWLSGTRIESAATHGTGCAFSSALLCGLVAGQMDAPARAKAYVAEAIRRAEPRGAGKGPMRLLWPVERRGHGG